MKLIIDIPDSDYYAVRCEALYYIGHDKLAESVTTAFQTAIPYEERPIGRWVSVSEGLPNRNGVYNVTRIIEGTRITDACYFDGQNTWHRAMGVNHGRPYLNDIIAWQPLPEPYKKGGAE